MNCSLISYVRYISEILRSNSASSKVEQQALGVEDAARCAVTALNTGRSGDPPTALEVQRWLESGRDLVESGAWMSARDATRVEVWSNGVDRASRSVVPCAFVSCF